MVPADMERALHDMLPDGIRENLKDKRVYSAVYGVYDENTANAVMRLQSDYKDKYHLNVSGVFDSMTASI